MNWKTWAATPGLLHTGCLIRAGQSAIYKLVLRAVVRINAIWLLNLQVPWFLASSGFISVCPAVSPELGTGGSQSAQSWVQEAARASVTHRGIASTVEMPDIPGHSGF